MTPEIRNSYYRWHLRSIIATTVLAVLALQACSTFDWNGTKSAPASASRTPEQRSSRGNPPFYEVFGERYYVLATSFNYKERGVASWYGKKFHGKPTSSGQIYDMHEMTAAHKTLPLPTTVRVTNLRNGKSIVVLVNDRGPFVDNRIIDLSYVAATQLDMVSSGTALVEVETLTTEAQLSTPVIAEVAEPELKGSSSVSPIPTAAADTVTVEPLQKVYLQIGAFGEQINARQLQEQVRTSGISNIVVHFDDTRQPALYRVRLGPINGADEYDALVEQMAAIQINDVHLVIESSAEEVVEPTSLVTGKTSGT
jgi:rare lipoprotein A